MTMRALLWLAVLAVAGSASVRAIDLRQRSESGNKQFVIYSDDVRLRQRVASFAEEVKTDVLQTLGVPDQWKAPVVVILARAATLDRGEPPVRLRVAETQPGFKIEIQVKIGEDPTEVNLRRVLLRALLLEYSYRRTGIVGGQSIVEPPWWIVEGLFEMARRRDQGADGAIFQRLIETNRLPPIETFLMQKPEELGPTAMAVDRSLAMCLLELLVKQPDGRGNLQRLLRDWPQCNGDPSALLARNFPDIGGGPVLQKWWTLNLARFSAADRYQGLTVEETDKALAALLQFEIPVGKEAKGAEEGKEKKEGEKKTFSIGEFPEYLKLPASKQVLTNRNVEILALSTRANALFRTVVAEYMEVFSLLGRGKTRGVKDRITKAEGQRQSALRRISAITDYLNWFEATQMESRSSVFDDYLKTANEISQQERKQKGLIGRYLDEVEAEFK